jgi:hypothetical protein
VNPTKSNRKNLAAKALAYGHQPHWQTGMVFSLQLLVAGESGGKPHALQTLRAGEGNRVERVVRAGRTVTGVRPYSAIFGQIRSNSVIFAHSGKKL